MTNNYLFFKKFILISNFQTIFYLGLLFSLFYVVYKLKKMGVSSSKRVILSTFLGLALGLFIQYYSGFSNKPTEISYVSETIKWYSLFGNGFMDLIKMLIIPLVFISIINVIININFDTSIKKLTSLTLFTTLGMVAISSIVGFLISSFAKLGVNSTVITSDESKIKEVKDIITIFRDLIPSNPVKAMAELNIIAVVIFALFIGIATREVLKQNSKNISTFIDFIGSLHTIISKMAVMIIGLMPYAIIPLLANTIAQRGIKTIKDVILFIALLYLALIIQFIVQSILLLLNGLSPKVYFKKAIEPLILAFNSRSSAGTLPLTIKTLTDKLGVNDSTANFVASFSSTAGMQGCAGIYPTMLIVYLANANNINIDFTLFMMAVIVVTLGSVGIAGVPGTALTAASVTVSGVGMGALFSQVNPILAVDPILDMGRTCLNVSGGMVNAIVVDKKLKTLNIEIFKK